MDTFTMAVQQADLSALRAERIDTLMVNVGLRCDQACSHCHQSCSPQRTEVMRRDVMESVAAVADELQPSLVDVTGGAPELNPDIRYLLRRLAEGGHPVRLRTNLTALLAPEAEGLTALLAELGISVLASLPGTTAEEVAHQRGPVFSRCIEGLRLLSAHGYGEDPRLRLDIAVNHVAGTSHESPAETESRFRAALTDELGVAFDDLILITNVPVGRFRAQLEREKMLESYLLGLRDAFNPATLPHLACRTSIEVAWDGTLSDCDFNLGRSMGLSGGLPLHVSGFDASVLATRPLRFADHCFACTAMAGSG